MPHAAPLILARHASTLPAQPGWTVPVYEGPANTEQDLTGWLTLAYVAGSDAPQIGYSQESSPIDGCTAESGTIVCELVAGGADVPAARAAIFALLDVWQRWLAADQSQGGAFSLADLRLGAEVTVGLTDGGGIAEAAVTITYTTHTYG